MLPDNTTKRKLITCPKCKGRCEIEVPFNSLNTSNHYMSNFLTSHAIYRNQKTKCPMCNGIGQIVEITYISYSLNLEEANEL